MTDHELMQQSLEALQAVKEAPSKDEIQRAWIVSDLLQRRLAQPECNHEDRITMLACVKCGALVGTPPQRKPLTDEEIRSIVWGDFGVDQEKHQAEVLPLARAIEAAHGIKVEA